MKADPASILNSPLDPKCSGSECCGCMRCGHVLEIVEWPPYCLGCGQEAPRVEGTEKSYGLIGGKCSGRRPYPDDLLN